MWRLPQNALEEASLHLVLVTWKNLRGLEDTILWMQLMIKKSYLLLPREPIGQ